MAREKAQGFFVYGGVKMKKETEMVNDVMECLLDTIEKIEKNRRKLSVIKDHFFIPPGCDGWHEPEYPVLFVMGVDTILGEILQESTDASDALSGVLRRLESNVKTVEVTA